MQLIHNLINSGNWVTVLYCLLVQISVINTHPECPILLLHQNHRRSKRTRTWSDEAQLKELVNGLLNFILESLWMLVGVYFDWKCIRFQLNPLFNATVWWPTMWKVFKNPLMLVEQFFNIFGLGGNFGSCSLGGDLAFNIPLNVSMPHKRSHTFYRNYIAGISIYTFQYH